MVEALIVISVVLSWVIAYSLGYEKGRTRERDIARQFIDAIGEVDVWGSTVLDSLEETIKPKKKRGRPVGSKNKPKVRT